MNERVNDNGMMILCWYRKKTVYNTSKLVFYSDDDDGTTAVESFSSSAHPQSYFSWIFEQSKISFPSRSFTLLWIAQAHWDAATLDDVCGGYCFSNNWKWAALNKKRIK